MKKTLLIALFAIACGTMAYAQPRAIGGRLGYGAEFSYEHTLGSGNMVSLEVGAPGFWGIEAACTHDWIDPFGATVPWNEKGEWHWYMGVGGAGGYLFNVGGAGWVGAAGHIGIEYDFWFPFQLSLDWRPCIGVTIVGDGVGFNTGGLYDGITLGVRYKF
jgi:hypothetical protein